jgi:mono/diheme cytochrome c family protein
MPSRLSSILWLMLVIILVGCNKPPQDSTNSTGEILPKVTDAATLATGEKIYRENCVKCHGNNAEGDPQWRKVGPDGRYPPPPLNGTGHSWHHSRAVLRDIIKNGSPTGQGNMPAWGGKLSDAQIEALVSYIQSLWPDDVYAAWYAMQQNSQ